MRLPDGRIAGVWLLHDGGQGEMRYLGEDESGNPVTVGTEVSDSLASLERIYAAELRQLAALGGAWRPEPSAGWTALRRDHGNGALPRDRAGRIRLPRARATSAHESLDRLARSGYLLERLGPLADVESAWCLLAVDGPDRAALWDDRGRPLEPAPLFAGGTLARFAAHVGRQGPALFAALAGRMEDGRVYGPLVIVDVLRLAGLPLVERTYQERRILRDETVAQDGEAWSVPIAEATPEGRLLFAINTGGWRISPLEASYADPERPPLRVRD